jgi:hypothetical protein
MGRVGDGAAVDVGVVVLTGLGWALGEVGTGGGLLAMEHPDAPSARMQASAAPRKTR